MRTDAEPTDEDQPVMFGMLINNEFVDQTYKLDVTLKRGEEAGWSREIEIKGKEDVDLMPGLYHIYFRTEGFARLYCDQVGLSTPPNVYSSYFPIELREDCNENGVDDAVDIANFPWLDDWGLNAGPWPNGRIDLCEWCAAGGDWADVNFDGYVNGDDFDLFSLWFTEGDGQADFDYNGFVNGDDFDLFAVYFGIGEGC